MWWGYIVSALLFFYSFSLFPTTGSLYKSARMAYNQGQYEECVSLLHNYIHTSETLSSKDRKVILYFITEGNIRKLDTVLNRLYEKERENLGKNFFILIYIFMDKAILSRDYKLAANWGEVFRLYAKPSNLYLKGMYLYSCILFFIKDYQALQLTLDEALIHESYLRSKDKFLLLNSAVPDEGFSVKNKHIRTAIRSKYRRLIFSNLIRFYDKTGRTKKSLHLKKVLIKYERIY